MIVALVITGLVLLALYVAYQLGAEDGAGTAIQTLDQRLYQAQAQAFETRRQMQELTKQTIHQMLDAAERQRH